jgi:hypothetical protein
MALRPDNSRGGAHFSHFSQKRTYFGPNQLRENKITPLASPRRFLGYHALILEGLARLALVGFAPPGRPAERDLAGNKAGMLLKIKGWASDRYLPVNEPGLGQGYSRRMILKTNNLMTIS